MITSAQWASLKYLTRSDFQYPDKLDWSTVYGIDVLARRLGSKPQVISDWRPQSETGQHPLGLAIDTYWPDFPNGAAAAKVADEILAMRYFHGIGIYKNTDTPTVTFHTDMRAGRTGDDPAKWGDMDSNRANVYQGWDQVLSFIRGSAPVLGIIAVVAFLVWFLRGNQT